MQTLAERLSACVIFGSSDVDEHSVLLVRIHSLFE